MSRSRKKHPGGGIAVSLSDKPYKEQEHRRERRRAIVALRRGEAMPAAKEFGNPWSSPKDGKQYWTDYDERWMRK